MYFHAHFKTFDPRQINVHFLASAAGQFTLTHIFREDEVFCQCCTACLIAYRWISDISTYCIKSITKITVCRLISEVAKCNNDAATVLLNTEQNYISLYTLFDYIITEPSSK